jgi:nanoRNase/pAp phosphatase (c-di-AMP/oligoRNAs hydrolase)
MRKLEPRPNQLFVDITPPLDRWRDWIPFKPIVLDHHETQREATDGLGGIYGYNETHSGAMLAYDYVLEPMVSSDRSLLNLIGSPELEYWRDFAVIAMVRDTWKKNHPRWRESGAQAMVLRFHGSKKLIEMVNTGKFSFKDLNELGMMLFEQAERKTKLVASTSYHRTIQTILGEFKISLFNCTEAVISDVANLLLEQGSDIAVGYFHLFQDGTLRTTVSVRTPENGKLIANKIAKQFPGGGGHACAAGFSVVGSETPDSLAEKIRQVV